MLGHLGVDNRHSMLTNYPAVVFEGAEPQLAMLGVRLPSGSADVLSRKLLLIQPR